MLSFENHRYKTLTAGINQMNPLLYQARMNMFQSTCEIAYIKGLRALDSLDNVKVAIQICCSYDDSLLLKHLLLRMQESGLYEQASWVFLYFTDQVNKQVVSYCKKNFNKTIIDKDLGEVGASIASGDSIREPAKSVVEEQLRKEKESSGLAGTSSVFYLVLDVSSFPINHESFCDNILIKNLVDQWKYCLNVLHHFPEVEYAGLFLRPHAVPAPVALPLRQPPSQYSPFSQQQTEISKNNEEPGTYFWFNSYWKRHIFTALVSKDVASSTDETTEDDLETMEATISNNRAKGNRGPSRFVMDRKITPPTQGRTGQKSEQKHAISVLELSRSEPFRSSSQVVDTSFVYAQAT